jgi:hypothetical protein
MVKTVFSRVLFGNDKMQKKYQFSNQNKFNKLAQDWGWTESFKEWANFGGARVEKKSDLFQLIMNNLRSVDNGIRATLLGKKMGDQAPYAGDLPIKKVLDLAQQNYNNKEYLLAISYLDQFYQKVLYCAQLLKSLDSLTISLNQEYFKSLAENLTDEQKERIKNYLAKAKGEEYLSEDERKKLKDLKENIQRDLGNVTSNTKYKIQKHGQFYKTAGLTDWIQQLFSSRLSALNLWEKIYPKASTDLKKNLRIVLSASNRLLNVLQTNLNKMSQARIDRQVADYVKTSKNIVDQVNQYSSSIDRVNFSQYADQLQNILNNVVPPEQQKEVGNTTSAPSSQLSAQVKNNSNTSAPAPSPAQVAAAPATPAATVAVVQAVVAAQPQIQAAQQQLAAANPATPEIKEAAQQAAASLSNLQQSIEQVRQVGQAEANIPSIEIDLNDLNLSIKPEVKANLENLDRKTPEQLQAVLPDLQRVEEQLNQEQDQPKAREAAGFFNRLIKSIKNMGKAKVEQVQAAAASLINAAQDAQQKLDNIEELSKQQAGELSPVTVEVVAEASKALQDAVPPIPNKSWFARAVISLRDFIGIPANTGAKATIDGKEQEVKIQGIDRESNQISVITPDGKQLSLPPENIEIDEARIRFGKLANLAGITPDVSGVADLDQYIKDKNNFILNNLNKYDDIENPNLAIPIAELLAAIDRVKDIIAKDPEQSKKYSLQEYEKLYDKFFDKFIRNKFNKFKTPVPSQEPSDIPGAEGLESKFKVGDILSISVAELFDFNTKEGFSAINNYVLQLYLEKKGYKKVTEDDLSTEKLSHFTLSDKNIVTIKIESIDEQNKKAFVIINDLKSVLGPKFDSPKIEISFNKLNQFATLSSGEVGVSIPDESSGVPSVVQQSPAQKLYNIIKEKLKTNKINVKIPTEYFFENLTTGMSPSLQNILELKDVKDVKNIKEQVKREVKENIVNNPDYLQAELYSLSSSNDKYDFIIFYQDKTYGPLYGLFENFTERAFPNVIRSMMPEIYQEFESSQGGSESIPDGSQSVQSTIAVAPSVEPEEDLTPLQKAYKFFNLEPTAHLWEIQTIVKELMMRSNNKDYQQKIIDNYRVIADSISSEIKFSVNDKISISKNIFINNLKPQHKSLPEILNNINDPITVTIKEKQNIDNIVYYLVEADIADPTSDTPTTLTALIPEQDLKNAKKASFVYILEKLSYESPIIVASFIRKYANLINKKNKKISYKLKKIASMMV